MEGMQYLEHHVAEGTYRAVLYWKIQGGKVYVKEGKSWLEVDVPIKFFPDRAFDTNATLSNLEGRDGDSK